MKPKFAAAKRADGLVQSGMKVGLGTGSTAAWLVKHLGQKISNEGLRIQAVPTSSRTADLAQKVGIETSFGRFEFDFNEIESARIDPSEILTRQVAAC